MVLSQPALRMPPRRFTYPLPPTGRELTIMAALLRRGVRFPARRSLPRLTHQTTQLVPDLGRAAIRGLRPLSADTNQFLDPEGFWKPCSINRTALGHLSSGAGHFRWLEVALVAIGVFHRKCGCPAILWPEGFGDCRLASTPPCGRSVSVAGCGSNEQTPPR